MSVQHKDILRRHLPEALRLAVAKNIENRLFSQASLPSLAVQSFSLYEFEIYYVTFVAPLC